MIFVLVAGPPGTGKTTLARPLASTLGLPLIAKDVIKDALMDVLGAPATVEESRALGRAAVGVMFAVAHTSPGAVLESPFCPESSAKVKELPGSIVEIHCRCPRDVALRRYRARSGERHRGHLDAERTDEELWNDELLRPLGLGALIEVDTTVEVDVASLAGEVLRVGAAF